MPAAGTLCSYCFIGGNCYNISDTLSSHQLPCASLLLFFISLNQLFFKLYMERVQDRRLFMVPQIVSALLIAIAINDVNCNDNDGKLLDIITFPLLSMD